MSFIKRRLHKKMHRRWLDVFGDEVTFSPHWRALLFGSEEGMAYPVDAYHHEGLKPEAVVILKKYDLRFCAERSGPRGVPVAWLAEYHENGNILFRVRAADYPSIECWSANNPDYIGPDD